jgi:DMSO/TMAO reductase YedYZ molybdopterin-dependent catalytic subunit
MNARAQRPGPAAREPVLPPGQRRVAVLPVQHVGDPPPVPAEGWTLALSGEVRRPRVLTLAELLALATVEVEADFHAGAGWSVVGLRWRGARLADLIAQARPTEAARAVRFSDGQRYDETLTLDASLEPDVVLAVELDGAPLPREHGGPLRLVAPARYGWKSVKWLRAVEVLADERPGFWERRGFHPGADPWKEQRFA